MVNIPGHDDKKMGLNFMPAGAVKFQFADYAVLEDIKVPPVFGHITEDVAWGMLGNDSVGDCTCADVAHQTMVHALATHRPLPQWSTPSTLKMYSAITGYNPDAAKDANGNNPTDQGANLAQVASYWRKTGFRDAVNTIHQSRSYGMVNSIDEALKATRLFGAVSIGVSLPSSAPEQFDHGKPWRFQRGAHDLGGHCITLVGRNRNGLLVFLTWGRTQGVTPDWLERYMVDGVVSFSLEYMKSTGMSPELFDVAALDKDLNSLGSPGG